MAGVEPLTAREALLEIRRRIAAADLNDPGALAIDLDLVADAGLSRKEPINFELSDQLADRLAESHRLLTLISVFEPDSQFEKELLSQVREALALPPDLEAMVERRIGRRP